MNYDVDMPRCRRCTTAPPRTPHDVHQTDVKRASGGPNPKRPAESYFTAWYLLNFITCPATFVRRVQYLPVQQRLRNGREKRVSRYTYAVYCLLFFFFSKHNQTPIQTADCKTLRRQCNNKIYMATDEFSRQINHRVSYYAAAAVVLYTDVAGMMYSDSRDVYYYYIILCGYGSRSPPGAVLSVCRMVYRQCSAV